MGIVIPGGKFRLTGEDGREIKEAGTTGELVYEGKNVMLGYAKNRSDLSKGDECRGILFTGDMARRDEAGFYYIAVSYTHLDVYKRQKQERSDILGLVNVHRL